MGISFSEFESIKQSLPKGSITRIAKELNIQEQTVRDYFSGVKVWENGQWISLEKSSENKNHKLEIEDTPILNLALKIIKEAAKNNRKLSLSRHLDQIMKDEDELLKRLA